MTRGLKPDPSENLRQSFCGVNMPSPSLYVRCFEGVEYHVFKVGECCYLSATQEDQRRGKHVEIEPGDVVILMGYIDDVKGRTEYGKRPLGEG